MAPLSLPTKPTLFHAMFWSSSRPLGVLMELGLVPLGGTGSTTAKSQDAEIALQVVSEEQVKTDPMLTKLNPQRRLPFFYDPTEDLRLNESGGLVQYILETYDKEHRLYPAPFPSDSKGVKVRAEFLKLIHFGPATSFHVVVPILNRSMPMNGSGPTPEDAYDAKKEEWHRFVAPTYERALETFGGPFLLGEKFSAADVVCGYDLMTVTFTDCAKELLDEKRHPKLKSYLDLISHREAYQALYTPKKSQE